MLLRATCKQMAQLVSVHGTLVSALLNSEMGNSCIVTWDNPLIVLTSKMSEISLKPVSIVLIWYKQG